MDFLRNRMFRSTLLCRAENQLNRTTNPDCLEEFYATPLVSIKQSFSETQPAVFLGQGGIELTVGDVFTSDIFSLIVENRRKINISGILDQVAEKHAEKLQGKDHKAVRADFGRIVLNGYFKKMIDFCVGPVTGQPQLGGSEHPQTLPLSRWQASSGHRISSSRLDMLTADPFVAKFITLCDGTRNREALIEAMVEAHNQKEYQLNENNQPVTDPERAKFIIERLYEGSLQNLENLGLLPRKAA